MSTEEMQNVCLFIWTILAINSYESINSNKDMRFMIKMPSATNYMPSFLLGFGADTWPTIFLVPHQISSALDIGNNV